uniref:Alpha/beta hydrolase family protein n=1 Tax=mine drainage metagenome TaxID=410659 RepID=E6Q0S8_9ZZZZ
MKLSGIPGPRYGSIPVVVLVAIITIIEKRSPILRETLFMKTREALASYRITAGDSLFHKALAYLIHDQAIRISDGKIIKLDGWSKSQTVEWAEQFGKASLQTRTSRARKAVGRKKIARRLTFRLDQFDVAATESTAKAATGAKKRRQQAETERHVVNVFYATDRQKSDEGYSANGIPDKGLHRGIATVSFPKRRHPGDTNDPPFNIELIASLFPGRFSSIEKLAPLGKTDFHNRLRTRLANDGNTMFVFVHGYACSFESAIKRTAQIKLDTKFKGTAVTYSWPSKGKISYYDLDHERICHAADVLSGFIDELRSKHENPTIHLVGHSMGAHIIALAIERRSRKHDIGEIVLQAPDISSLDYGRFAAAFSSSAKRVTVYASKKDRALTVSQVKRLARGVYRIGQNVRHALNQAVDAIDATRFGEDGLFGHGYAFKRALITDLRETLDGMDQTRPQLIERYHDGERFFEFHK